MNDKYIELIDAILAKSKQGAINWLPTSLYNEYQANIGSGAVTIYYNEHYMGNFDEVRYRIAFLNERGEAFHQIYCDSEIDENFNRISTLFTTARESYYKTNETIASMFDTLSKL